MHFNVAQVLLLRDTIIHEYKSERKRLTPKNIATKYPAISPISPEIDNSIKRLVKNINEV
jgi:hypothetical protein